MSIRLTLPLAGLVLAGCVSTAPQSTPQAGTPDPGTHLSLPGGSAATVDEHLFEPEVEAPAETSGDTPDASPEPVTASTPVYENVWQRMVANFALPECSTHQISRDWAQWYAERPEYMGRVLKRAQPWIWFIVEELEFRGMPGELALLPIVESAYDPFAYSSGRALGAWQFIGSTGREYGLQQNWWYDGRRDVWASTHAALDYLLDLDVMFKGDWLLALASYNSGQGRVMRSVTRNRKAGKPADFWNIRLPRETRGYVPKLLGLACLFRDPDQYGFKLPATPNRQVITAIDFGAQTDLVLIAQAAEVPIDVLFTLNPGYNRWATSPDGPYRVVLPLKDAARLRDKLQDVDPATLMKWDQVTVQNGDTLSHLASVHHVPVDVIRTANKLDGDLIRVGQKLRLPRDEQLLVDPLYASAAAELQQLQAGLLASDRATHTVRTGESLSVIARRYRVSTRELQQWNKLSNPNRLRAGQKLTVFLSPAPVVQKPAPARYTVRNGDSLWSIARKHKVKLNDLMRWNGLTSNSVLHPGQSLKILF